MDSITDKAQQLRHKISQAEKELQDLRRQLEEIEESNSQSQDTNQQFGSTSESENTKHELPEWKWPLSEEEYSRYGRQLILPTVGIKGQLRLKSAAVLIVGAGGLGCPAAAYLAGAGVGTLGIVDGDTVEVSNLHRQIAHNTPRVGMMKVDSLVEYCRGLNPNVSYVAHREHLTPQNSEDIVSKYDLVLDCTDHPTSRYLISDICVLLQKPLVSASALRTDGQLIVLNNPPAAQGSTEGGPCYRCIFPKPPPAESVVSCGEGGILGPVVGVMGVLQALEAIKLVVAGVGKDSNSTSKDPVTPSLLLFSATSTTPFRSIRMRSRRPNCFACSSESTLTLKELRAGSLDYVQFCGVTKPVDVLKPEERVSATEYNAILTKQSDMDHLLLDVREKEHFEIASIPGAINVPFSTLQARSKNSSLAPEYIPKSLSANAPIYVICRVGNDSQLATRRLKEMGLDANGERFVGDIEGGMLAWKRHVDQTMPFT
ncbi:adenylyltransferase [Daldinia caldariorum]|uniref:adenylyltransferase n=1 Tax=Daldinia caldariorum TaxID=326644 RepID=UPI0020081AAA|nr:adenylyltransferase [Daldinia caldariorum]KAI1465645.1 adenylyltransferase [Daldinia caldariorum]